mgnify:CR=1 FL=1
MSPCVRPVDLGCSEELLERLSEDTESCLLEEDSELVEEKVSSLESTEDSELSSLETGLGLGPLPVSLLGEDPVLDGLDFPYLLDMLSYILLYLKIIMSKKLAIISF